MKINLQRIQLHQIVFCFLLTPTPQFITTLWLGREALSISANRNFLNTQSKFIEMCGLNYELSSLRSDLTFLTSAVTGFRLMECMSPKIKKCCKLKIIFVYLLFFHFQLVSNFLNLKCCSRWFPSRVDLEEHRLSLLHLRVNICRYTLLRSNPLLLYSVEKV